MKVNREDVLIKLETIVPGITTDDVIEQGNCFVFVDGQVVSFNDEVACFAKLDLGFEGAVQAKLFLGLLRKMTEEIIDISLDESVIVVKGKRKKAKIVVENDIVLGVEDIESPEDWSKLDDDFSNALSTTIHCASKVESQFLLTCIHICPDCLEACDRYQIIKYPIVIDISDNVLVKATSLRYVADMGMSEFSLTKNWIHFRNDDGSVFSCRIYNETFIKTENHFNTTGDKVEFPKDLNKAITTAAIFATDSNSDDVLKIKLTRSKMKVTGEGTSGVYTEVIPIDYEGKEIEFFIAPKFLSEVLKYSYECVVSKERLMVTTDKFKYATCCCHAPSGN